MSRWKKLGVGCVFSALIFGGVESSLKLINFPPNRPYIPKIDNLTTNKVQYPSYRNFSYHDLCSDKKVIELLPEDFFKEEDNIYYAFEASSGIVRIGTDKISIEMTYWVGRKYKPPKILLGDNLKGTRIAMIGGSAILGWKLPSNKTIPARTQYYLRNNFSHPSTLINGGKASFDSKHVKNILKDMIYYSDIIVVHSGNNEFLQNLQIDDRFAHFVQFSRDNFMNSFKTYQLLEYSIEYILNTYAKNKFYDYLKKYQERGFEVEQLLFFIRDKKSIEDIVETFRENLYSIVKFIKKHNKIPILSTVAVNLKCAPAFYGNVNREAANIFKLAVQLESRGNYEEALKAYEKARDLDICFSRAPSYINEIIKDVAEKTDTLLVDVEEFVKRSSPYKIPGYDFFYDAVHYTPEGADKIGNFFAEEIYKFAHKKRFGTKTNK